MRRTEIAIGVYSIQVLCGIYLVNYATYFFEQAGLPDTEAFNMGLGFLAVGFVGTVLSWFLIPSIGRRTIYLWGLMICTVILLIIGILDCVPNYKQRKGVIWGQSALMIVWNFFYDISVGPINFIIICETSATKLRGKTIAVATAVQAACGIVITVAMPYMLNPDEANMRGKLGFLFGVGYSHRYCFL
ncbi:hypothetical protein KEM55_002031 [Ascosphaera atra]|nr:hypothetical protein KEM55_002031 [Ascosphaera atra]